LQPLDCKPLICDRLCGPLLVHGRQVRQGNVKAVDVGIVHDHHALLLYLVQILGVCRVVFAFSEARGPHSDQLARGGAVEGVNLKTVRGDVGRVGRPLERPRGVVHVHHELARGRILLHLAPVELKAAARACKLYRLGAHVLVRPFVFPVVKVEDANRSLAQGDGVGGRVRRDEAGLDLDHPVCAQVELEDIPRVERARLAAVVEVAGRLHPPGILVKRAGFRQLRPSRCVLGDVHDDDREVIIPVIGRPDTVQLHIRLGAEEGFFGVDTVVAHVGLEGRLPGDFNDSLLSVRIPCRTAQ